MHAFEWKVALVAVEMNGGMSFVNRQFSAGNSRKTSVFLRQTFFQKLKLRNNHYHLQSGPA